MSRLSLHLGRSRVAHLARLALLLAIALPATAAHAGTYVVESCRHADGSVAPTDGWREQAGTPPSAAVSNSCPVGGALTASMYAYGAGSHGANSSVGFSFSTSSPWLVPQSATLWQWAVLESADPGVRWVALTSAPNAALSEGSILSGPSGPGTFGSPQTPLADGNRVEVPTSHLGARDGGLISLRVFCDGGSWLTNCGGNASIGLTRARITIEDRSPPQARTVPSMISPAGALSGTLSGTVPLPISADDEGSGLARAIVVVDGKDAASTTFGDNAGRCIPVGGAGRTYGWVQPCPRSANATLLWNTAGVADGTHEAQLVAEDASGNRTVAASSPIVIRNASAIGPGSPLAVRGEPNGTPSDDGAQVNVSWKSAGKRPPSTTVTRAWSSGEDTIIGRLTTAGGQAIAGAKVQVASTAMIAGASETPVSVVTTAQDGSFEQRVLRETGSTTFTVRYFARSADTVAARVTTLTRTVRASTSLSVPRSAARGARITFRGVLDGRAGTLSRVPIELQVMAGGRWRTFASAQTGTRGRWQRRFRFATTPGRYRVRARVGVSVAYPYARGTSRTATVRVR